MEGTTKAATGGGGNVVTPTATAASTIKIETLQDCFEKSNGDAGLFFELYFANFFTVIWPWAWFTI